MTLDPVIVVMGGLLLFCLGFILGARLSDSYWAEHGKNGGAVHHRGKFYVVRPE